MNDASLVTMVLDPECGDTALEFAKDGPVWAVVSQINTTTSEKAAQNGMSFTLLYVNGKTSEEWFLNHLDTVDIHHNDYSQKPGYSVLHVVGTELTPRIESYLPEFGFVKYHSTTDGFFAYKL